MTRTEAMEDALREFIQCINLTGGLAYDDRGFLAPAIDPDWIDLGIAYEKACAALGIEPMVEE